MMLAAAAGGGDGAVRGGGCVREAGMLLPGDGRRCARGGRHRAGSRTGPAAAGTVFGTLPGLGPSGAAWQPVTTPTATGS